MLVGGGGSVAIEGFVVYTGEDYGLHLNVLITCTNYGRT